MTKTPSSKELAQFISNYNKRRLNKKYTDIHKENEADNFIAERISTYSYYKNKRELRGKK